VNLRASTKALSKIAKTRLNTLIRFMASLPKSAEKNFNMGSWYIHRPRRGHKHVHALGKDGTILLKTLRGCGTTACAAGWAAAIPEFRKAGFTYTPREGFSMDRCEFFGITLKQEDELFYAFNVYTPREWASMAREKLKKWSRK
jgi:hypothetical protein